MSDFVSSWQAPRTWRGFLARVAAIAVAGLIVLAAADLFEYLHDPHPARIIQQNDRERVQPPRQDMP